MNTLILSIVLLGAAPSPSPEVDLQPNMAAGCEKLSYAEQQFAQNLTTENNMIFCSLFSEDQRQETLALSLSSKSTGSLMSNNQVVENIAHKYGISSQENDQPIEDSDDDIDEDE